MSVNISVKQDKEGEGSTSGIAYLITYEDTKHDETWYGMYEAKGKLGDLLKFVPSAFAKAAKNNYTVSERYSATVSGELSDFRNISFNISIFDDIHEDVEVKLTLVNEDSTVRDLRRLTKRVELVEKKDDKSMFPNNIQLFVMLDEKIGTNICLLKELTKRVDLVENTISGTGFVSYSRWADTATDDELMEYVVFRTGYKKLAKTLANTTPKKIFKQYKINKGANLWRLYMEYMATVKNLSLAQQVGYNKYIYSFDEDESSDESSDEDEPYDSSDEGESDKKECGIILKPGCWTYKEVKVNCIKADDDVIQLSCKTKHGVRALVKTPLTPIDLESSRQKLLVKKSNNPKKREEKKKSS